jgi:hypothetical protein
VCPQLVYPCSLRMRSCATQLTANILVILCSSLFFASISLAQSCNISRCFNATSGLAAGVGTIHNATSNYSAIQAYHSCIARAGSIRAFQCRCSLKLRDCAVDPQGGNCTELETKPACQQMLQKQGLGCNLLLCTYSAAGTGPFTALQTAAVVLLLFASTYFL